MRNNLKNSFMFAVPEIHIIAHIKQFLRLYNKGIVPNSFFSNDKSVSGEIRGYTLFFVTYFSNLINFY